MCGDGEAAGGDILNDGDSTEEANPDQLWAANNTDTDYCGHASTYWDNWATPMGSCGTNYLNDKPELCP